MTAEAQDEPSGENSLGKMNQRGRGVPKDLVEAARLYKLAEALNYTPARENLGSLGAP